MGSASIECEIAAADGPVRVLFSGDLGPDGKLLLFDPEGPHGVDHLVCESTYGDTERPALTDAQRRALLLAEVRAAADNGGALIIPSFAVERTQELLVDLVALMTEGDTPHFPIFIDSPLATLASEVFERHASGLEHGRELIRALQFQSVRFTESVEQSKAIARIRGFHIIISASGMCEAGRVRHHLRNWLWRPEATVLLVGFQAQGTLGRILQDGARRVRIMGEDIGVRARVRSLDIYSGHADGPALKRWIEHRSPVNGSIFLVHGEERGMEGLTARLARHPAAARILAPALDERYELRAGAAATPTQGQAPARLSPEKLGRIDWHNDLSRLVLDIDDAVRSAADERGRARLIRRLRKALETET